jgi:hypothetical protein
VFFCVTHANCDGNVEDKPRGVIEMVELHRNSRRLTRCRLKILRLIAKSVIIQRNILVQGLHMIFLRSPNEYRLARMTSKMTKIQKQQFSMLNKVRKLLCYALEWSEIEICINRQELWSKKLRTLIRNNFYSTTCQNFECGWPLLGLGDR